MARNRLVLDQKLSLAREIVSQLAELLAHDLRAAGVCGSVGRGTAQKYSDIDFLIIVRRNPPSLRKLGIRKAHDGNRFLIRDDTYCSLGFETWKSAVGQLTRPSYELPELLGGYTKILPVRDPENLLPRLERLARHVTARVFRESAELALLHSYEDFCRVKNAYLAGDEIVMKDNVQFVTHSAALVVAALNNAHFRSDREIFKAHRNFSKLPRRFGKIEKLRYENLQGQKLFQTFVQFYLDLIAFANEQGISFPVEKKKLLEH